MGMSIEEIIQGIQIIKAQAEWDYPLDWQIVLDGAIETMQKYQKIEKIVKFGNANELGFEYVGEKITEVMENA